MGAAPSLWTWRASNRSTATAAVKFFSKSKGVVFLGDFDRLSRFAIMSAAGRVDSRRRHHFQARCRGSV